MIWVAGELCVRSLSPHCCLFMLSSALAIYKCSLVPNGQFKVGCLLLTVALVHARRSGRSGILGRARTEGFHLEPASVLAFGGKLIAEIACSSCYCLVHSVCGGVPRHREEARMALG